MVRAVLLDLDGTLLPIDFEVFFAKYVKRLVGWYHAKMGIDIRTALRAATDQMMRNTGPDTNADVFWSTAAPMLSRTVDELLESYAEFLRLEGPLLKEDVKADPAAASVVAACRAAGKRVVLATSPVFERSMLELRLSWADLDPATFDLVTTIREMRACKPNVAYFREIAERLDVEPADCLMVGNDVTMDLVPARRVGMRTCLVAGPHTARNDSGFTPDYEGSLSSIEALVVTGGP
jgi:FMN phosphatase YigB (HAD superfamily)